MPCRPECLVNHQRRNPRVSVILIDWGVRESFHSVHYLNRQTIPRGDYELICLPMKIEGGDGAPARVVLRG